MAYKALVLGADSRILLSVVRSLGRSGVQVHLAADAPEHVALQSRYLHRVHRLPPTEESDVHWKNGVIALMRRHRFDVVMPCTDAEVLACHRHRHELQANGKVWMPNDRAIDVLFDKFKSSALARLVDVPTPREVIVREANPPGDVIGQFGLPLVLKPARTTDPNRLGILNRVRKAYTADEFQRLLPRMLAEGPVAVQENIIGAGVGVELLLNEGKPLLAFQHCRVHEPLHGGPSSYRKSQALSPELLAASVKILQAVGYTGVAMVEFKVNEALGTWAFIEVNARFWGSLPLALAAGADFPMALFQLLVEGRTEFANNYRKDVHCRNWPLDWEWQRANFYADRADPTLASRPLAAVLKDLCRNVIMDRERSDTFTLDDPRPGLAELFALARRCGTKLFGTLGGTSKPRRNEAILAGTPVRTSIAGCQDGMLRGALRG